MTQSLLRTVHKGKCDPCEDIQCSFHAQCVVNSNYKPSCKCPKCPPTARHVCGSDGKTYVNECELRKRSCTTKTSIRVIHQGTCNPCKGVKCKNYGVCKANPLSTKGYQCVCRECATVLSPVCGSDRRTYRSECLLKRTSCRKNNKIYITHPGPCDLCKTKKCYHNATCVIGKDYQAYCRCPQCPNKKGKPVCGSDGNTYPSECDVRKASCMTASPITIVKQSKCDHCDCPPYAECQRDERSAKGFKCVCPSSSLEDQSKVCGTDGRTYTNRQVLQRESCLFEVKVSVLYSGICLPCRGRECSHHAECVARGNQGICQCPTKCPDDIKPRTVCASDGKTYNNECELKRASCLQQKPLQVKHKGPCGKHSIDRSLFFTPDVVRSN